MTAPGGFITKSEVFTFQTAPGPRLLTIDGVKNARKDIAKWSQAKDYFAYYFDKLFNKTLL